MSVAAAKVQVRWRPLDTAGGWQYKDLAPGEGSVRIDGLERGVEYQFEARAVSITGAASEWVGQSHIVDSTATPPLAPTINPGVSLADGVHLSWTVTDSQRTDTEYQVQRTNDVSGAPNESGWADLVRIRALAYTDGVTDGVVRWYRVRAITYLGVASAWSSEVNSRGKTVADGATVGAILGPGGNVSGAIDANLRPLIDFSQPTHLNKTQDNIPGGSVYGQIPLGLVGNDGRAPGTPGHNLVYNGDFSIHTPPTGQQSAYASSIRIDDSDSTGAPRGATPNGWTRNFDNSGNGEGVFYRADLSAFGFSPAGTYAVVQQDRNGSTGDCFSVVSDAIPVIPGNVYRFSANISPGLGSAMPAHARWHFRVYFYKSNASDFSHIGTLSSVIPSGTGDGSGVSAGVYGVVEGSGSTTTRVYAANITVPADAGFARIAFYHYYDFVTLPTIQWNLCWGDVKCVSITDTAIDFSQGSHIAKHLGNIPDDSGSSRFAVLAVDGNRRAIIDFSQSHVNKHLDPSTSQIDKKGSMPVSLNSGLSWSSTSTSITWGPLTLTGFRTDAALTPLSIPVSQTVTGLGTLTSYNHYPFLDENTGGFNMVATGGTGSPAWAHVGTSQAWTAEQARQDHLPLSLKPVPASTTSSGTGGGSDPGSGTCPRADMKVEHREWGVITAGVLADRWKEREEHFIRWRDKWVRVVCAIREPNSRWIEIAFDCGESFIGTPGHAWTLMTGEIKQSNELTVESPVPWEKGGTFPRRISIIEAMDDAVLIRVDSPEQLYNVGAERPILETHNGNILPC